MPLTFTSWDLCDDPDNPTLPWLSADDLRGRQPWRYLEAVRQAVVEGASVNGLSDPRGPYPMPDEFQKGERLQGWEGRCRKMHLAVTRLITADYSSYDLPFVNHLDNGGNWTGLAAGDVAPAWTEANILAECTETTRIPCPQHGNCLWADWLFQQYEILNLLRWVRNVASAAYIDSKDYKYVTQTSVVSWADAVALATAAWTGTSWLAVWLGPYRPEGLWNGFGKGRKPPESGVEDWQCSVHRTRYTPLIRVKTDTIKHTADYWGIMYEPVGGSTHFWDVEGLGYPAPADGAFIVQDFPAEATSLHTGDDIGNISAFPPVPPSPPESDAYTQGWRLDPVVAVTKWDIVDGLVFQPAI